MATKEKIPAGFKPSPLGPIPSDWEVKSIGEAFSICNNLRFPLSEEVRKNMKGKYPYYGPTKIQDYINEYRVNGKYALIGEDGDHFLKWRDYPMTLLIEGKFNVNNHAHLVKGEQNLTEWFFYFFNHRELTPYLTRQGAGRYKLTKDALTKMLCVLPPLPEQHSITNCFGVWDEAIKRTTQLILQKELQKKWFMQILLSGKKRMKGFKGKWTGIKFGEIYTAVKEPAGIVKHLPLSVTKNGIVSQADYFNKEIQSEDTSPYLVVRKGNMVMSGLNFWMGAIDVLTDFDSGMVSPAYKVFDIINSDISASYMKYFVRSEVMLRALIGASVQGASIVRRNLDIEMLEEWLFLFPTKKEQEAISKVLQTSDKEIQILKNKLDKLKEQKKGLMQQLLTGKKRLKTK